ncbi:hypothetical protein R6258_00605 [Halomonas sp. HP20-15]|uniref:hypothetical protein n=1 Tax=Halomonas sp. HP20-15 TaxID=3085901 RepID=UPI002981DF19|nr:hypothetical protein [Halomonas sp. HP20-15]MDW5375405.1 hypothetical protein [Halomonas sp. HP20-15]
MFFSLLLSTFCIAAAVSAAVVALFYRPVARIFQRIVEEDISGAWHRYVTFAGLVVGISGGVRVYDLERYISALDKDTQILVLTSERWTLEIYRTIIETLQSIAWMYLVVFVIALLAFVILKGFELLLTAKK